MDGCRGLVVTVEIPVVDVALTLALDGRFDEAAHALGGTGDAATHPRVRLAAGICALLSALLTGTDDDLRAAREAFGAVADAASAFTSSKADPTMARPASRRNPLRKRSAAERLVWNAALTSAARQALARAGAGEHALAQLSDGDRTALALALARDAALAAIDATVLGALAALASGAGARVKAVASLRLAALRFETLVAELQGDKRRARAAPGVGAFAADSTLRDSLLFTAALVALGPLALADGSAGKAARVAGCVGDRDRGLALLSALAASGVAAGWRARLASATLVAFVLCGPVAFRPRASELARASGVLDWLRASLPNSPLVAALCALMARRLGATADASALLARAMGELAARGSPPALRLAMLAGTIALDGHGWLDAIPALHEVALARNASSLNQGVAALLLACALDASGQHAEAKEWIAMLHTIASESNDDRAATALAARAAERGSLAQLALEYYVLSQSLDVVSPDTGARLLAHTRAALERTSGGVDASASPSMTLCAAAVAGRLGQLSDARAALESVLARRAEASADASFVIPVATYELAMLDYALGATDACRAGLAATVGVRAVSYPFSHRVAERARLALGLLDGAVTGRAEAPASAVVAAAASASMLESTLAALRPPLVLQLVTGAGNAATASDLSDSASDSGSSVN